MKTKPEKTKVVFRKWNSGAGVIALFPQIPHDTHGYHCSSYEHIGQHGSADPETIVLMTSPAKEHECAALKSELEGIGYNLAVAQKCSHYADFKIRQATARKTA